jgi:hypothetical protein
MHEYLLWIPLAAYAIHVLEEATLNWKQWAIQSLKLTNVEWFIFDIANMAVMFIAIAAAMVGWKLPEFALIIAALMFINGLFFHILPTIFQKTFSPGVITATLLFMPISIWVYYGAYQDGLLTLSVLVMSLVLGSLLMASPIFFLKLRNKINL